MTTLDMRTLSDRTREIFRRLVDQYLTTGEPVGSRTLSKMPGLNLSPASIRNVMQDLEELGLLAAPHTSAGRLPTQLGLRLFVDGLMQLSDLDGAQKAQIEAQCRADGKQMEDVLAQATSLLSGLSSCAGLVLVPKAEVPIRQVDFVPLSPRTALAILVGSDGSVENRLLELPVGFPTSALIQASNFINMRFANLTLEQARARLAQDVIDQRLALDAAASLVVEKGLAVWAKEDVERDILIVRGQANLLEDANVQADLERVRQLLDELESKRELIRILEMARDGHGMRIFIGAENKLFSLSGSSVIATPYKSADERLVGVIGVIGPTRLNYARVVPMVDYTAKVLARLLG